MERVITINLNGKAYQLDDSAYDALRSYLDRAEALLADNPDRAEILTDFEQAIAEKCDRCLGPRKTVVSRADMEGILAEMGPVEGEASQPSDETGDATRTAAGDKPPKRLYRIPEGAMFGGVCTGLSAYFGIDVTIVRLIFAATAFLGFGTGLLLYWGLMIIVPEATTSEQHAAAHGQAFNAQELIEQAKRAASDLKVGAEKTGAHLKNQWRRQRRQWRAQQGAWGAYSAAGVPGRPWTAIALPFVALFTLLCFVGLVWSIITVLHTGPWYGWAMPFGLPMWMTIVLLIVLFQITTTPLRAMRHDAYRPWPHPYGWLTLWDSLVGLAFTFLVLWVLFQHMGPVDSFRDFFEELPRALRSIGRDVAAWLQRF